MALFDDFIFDATDGGKPSETIVTPVDEIKYERSVGRYLWVIDRYGLKLILEATPNNALARGIVCHTNITGGEPALQGGELWFGDDGKVYINNKSGRYGSATPVQDAAVFDYFVSLGYDVVQLSGHTTG
ncbi:hypothetical protein [Fibrella aquatilis]|uniref:Uncharacterized protein n=1 Tax=Fibrella aquatilis TaxID=2817059 RepID=A0A939G5U3_9BACT|nr:hypothetical protein [Fibrella aquatilis]MBO0931169.1 hypothetical protein [Fibrella aquatilis]